MPKGYFVISETTVNFLRDSFERAVEDLLDDPDGMFPGGEGLKEHIQVLAAVGRDLEMPLTDLVARTGTLYERERLQQMLGQSHGTSNGVANEPSEGNSGT